MDGGPVAGGSRQRSGCMAGRAARRALCAENATLINNAGVIPRIAPLSTCTSAQDMADWPTPCAWGWRAPMLLTAAFLGARPGGFIPRKVLNISSGWAGAPWPRRPTTARPRWASRRFTRCWRWTRPQAHGAKGIYAPLAPGVIDTDMQVQLRGASQPTFGRAGASLQGRAACSPRRPLPRPAMLAWLQRPDFGNITRGRR